MLRRNGPVVKSVESVLRPEGSLWGERFVEEVGLEASIARAVKMELSGKTVYGPVLKTTQLSITITL